MTSKTSEEKPLATHRRQVRLWVGLGFALLAVVGSGTAGAWWWFRETPLDPPMPPDILDAEVRLVTARARQKVLTNPGDADAWGNLGMTLLASTYEQEADRCFTEAARLNPADARWPYGRGFIALKRDQEHAVPLLRQALGRADSWREGRAGMRLQLAEALLARREMDEAERLFQEELHGESRTDRATFGLGLVAVARGNNRAAEDYLRAVQGSPFARKKATSQLAVLAANRGDEAAAAHYEKQASALPEDPPWPDPFMELLADFKVGHRYWEKQVESLERQRRFREAADIYFQQIRDKPTSRAYMGAGVNLARMEAYSQALPLLREAIKLEPDNPQAHFNLALAQINRAKKELQQSPDSAEAKDWLQDAVDHARRTVDLKPDHAQAYLYWGVALRHLGEPAKAVEPLRQAVARRPESFELQLNLGEALLDAGQKAEAEIYLQQAHDLSPNDPRPIQHLERLRKSN
jgi:tetratricopeptide (TPR) repeat protein